MTFVTPTVANILGRAWKMAWVRTELLLLLSLLCGILTAILYGPSSRVLDDLVLAINSVQQAEQVEQVERAKAKVLAVLEQGGTTLLLGHLMITATAAVLLIPWARATAPGSLVPGAGGSAALIRRSLRSFLHMLAAMGLSVFSLLFILRVADMVGSVLGGLSPIVMIAALMLVIWLSLAFSGTANLAISGEARDRQETLFSAGIRARLFLRAICGSLAALFLIMLLVNMTVGTLIVSLAPDFMASTVANVISGISLYLISALHIAGLYLVPDFRDLRV